MFDLLLKERQSRVDKILVIALGCLILLGTAFIYSATTAREGGSSAVWYNQMWVRQVVWYAAGIGSAVALCLIDYRTLARWSYVIYWVAIVLLVAVLIPGIGSMRFGARRWF